MQINKTKRLYLSLTQPTSRYTWPNERSGAAPAQRQFSFKATVPHNDSRVENEMDRLHVNQFDGIIQEYAPEE